MFKFIELERKNPKCLMVSGKFKSNFRNYFKNEFENELKHALLVGKNCTFWSNCLELLAAFHENIKTNIRLISINTFKKYKQYYFFLKKLSYILPLSFKILLNLCLLSSKQDTACKYFKTSRRSKVIPVVFFRSL